MPIIRKKLTVDEITPANVRWNVDCDCVQSSPDGGITWNNAPGLDPRHADSARAPTTSSPDPQCAAAARMAAYLHDQVDAFITSVGLAQAATAALELLLVLIPGAGIVVDAIIAALELLITIGVDVIEGAFTDAVYADLVCTFYCHLDASGHMSAAQFADFQADVEAHYSATVYATIVAIGGFTGEVGYSNAAYERTETGDCSTCNCCNCIDYVIPTAATWALVPCAGSNFVHFDSAGMYTDIPSPFSEAAYIDLRTITAAGSAGWCFSWTMTGPIGHMNDAYVAVDVGDVDHCPHSTTEISHYPSQQIIVPTAQPIVVFVWADHDIRITGFCAQAAG